MTLRQQRSDSLITPSVREGEQDLGYSYAVVGGFIGVVMLEDNLTICTKVLNAH